MNTTAYTREGPRVLGLMDACVEIYYPRRPDRLMPQVTGHVRADTVQANVSSCTLSGDTLDWVRGEQARRQREPLTRCCATGRGLWLSPSSAKSKTKAVSCSGERPKALSDGGKLHTLPLLDDRDRALSVGLQLGLTGLMPLSRNWRHWAGLKT